MDKDQLKALLKEHLHVSLDSSRGSYGSGGLLTLKVAFDGELITDTSISLSSSGASVSGPKKYVITIDDYRIEDETRLDLIKSVVDGIEEIKANSALLHRYDVLDQLAYAACPLQTSVDIVNALFGKLVHPET